MTALSFGRLRWWKLQSCDEVPCMRVTLALFALLLAGCSERRDLGDPVQAVQEAVFRYEFNHNASLQQKLASAYFLALGDPHGTGVADPPDEFIARFSGHVPRVAKHSEAAHAEGGWVIDPTNRLPALIFYAYDVKITAPDSARASGAYREDPRSGAGHTYQLKRQRDGWKVVRTQLNWLAQTGDGSSAGLRFADEECRISPGFRDMACGIRPLIPPQGRPRSRTEVRFADCRYGAICCPNPPCHAPP